MKSNLLILLCAALIPLLSTLGCAGNAVQQPPGKPAPVYQLNIRNSHHRFNQSMRVLASRSQEGLRLECLRRVQKRLNYLSVNVKLKNKDTVRITVAAPYEGDSSEIAIVAGVKE